MVLWFQWLIVAFGVHKLNYPTVRREVENNKSCQISYREPLLVYNQTHVVRLIRKAPRQISGGAQHRPTHPLRMFMITRTRWAWLKYLRLRLFVCFAQMNCNWFSNLFDFFMKIDFFGFISVGQWSLIFGRVKKSIAR